MNRPLQLKKSWWIKVTTLTVKLPSSPPSYIFSTCHGDHTWQHIEWFSSLEAAKATLKDGDSIYEVKTVKSWTAKGTPTVTLERS